MHLRARGRQEKGIGQLCRRLIPTHNMEAHRPRTPTMGIEAWKWKASLSIETLCRQDTSCTQGLRSYPDRPPHDSGGAFGMGFVHSMERHISHISGRARIPVAPLRVPLNFRNNPRVSNRNVDIKSGKRNAENAKQDQSGEVLLRTHQPFRICPNTPELGTTSFSHRSPRLHRRSREHLGNLLHTLCSLALHFHHLLAVFIQHCRWCRGDSEITLHECSAYIQKSAKFSSTIVFGSACVSTA